MSKAPFELWDAAVFTLADTGLAGDGTVVLAESAFVANQNNPVLRAMNLIIEYDATPDGAGGLPSFEIGAVVEGKNGAHWYPIAYQFSPYRYPQQGRKRIITLDPDATVLDAGVDDIVYVANEVQAKINRQQGTVPDEGIRVRLLLTEYDFGGPNSFQQATVTAYGELYNAV